MPHIHELIDFVAEVFVVYENKVLLRIHDKYHFWCSVGGHIGLDEEPNEAAIREVKEEVGLDVTLFQEKPLIDAGKGSTDLVPPQFMNLHDINETHKHISLTYFATTGTDKLVLSETEKSAGCKWFTSMELDDPKYGLKPAIRHYAKAALDKLSKI